MQSPKLCDVTKVAACGSVAAGRLGKVGKIGGSFLWGRITLCGPLNSY